MLIKEILKNAINNLKENNIEEPTLKARLLLAYTINKDKVYLISHDNDELSFEEESKFNLYISKLIEGEPIQYIIGKQEFMGIEFSVNKNVLIPQPDTEILVEEVIKIAKGKNGRVSILDLCTGSGAIGISIAKNIKCNLIMSDISTEALEVAKYNSENILKESGNIILSDLFENINEEFDIIVSNPPYIETQTIPTLSKEVQNEPLLALDGGKDGLDIYKRIICEGYKYLKEDGILALEIGETQKEAVIDLLKQNGNYEEIYSKRDLTGNDRIVISRRK